MTLDVYPLTFNPRASAVSAAYVSRVPLRYVTQRVYASCTRGGIFARAGREEASRTRRVFRHTRDVFLPLSRLSFFRRSLFDGRNAPASDWKILWPTFL
jgi:hypothetical protein